MYKQHHDNDRILMCGKATEIREYNRIKTSLHFMKKKKMII